VQVGTSCHSAVSSGTDYAFISKTLEDCRRQISALTAWIHLVGEPHDLSKSRNTPVFSSRHTFTDICEELEVLLLTGLKRILPEVRNDSIDD
jgi:hypothetical protein